MQTASLGSVQPTKGAYCFVVDVSGSMCTAADVKNDDGDKVSHQSAVSWQCASPLALFPWDLQRVCGQPPLRLASRASPCVAPRVYGACPSVCQVSLGFCLLDIAKHAVSPHREPVPGTQPQPEHETRTRSRTRTLAR